MNKSGFTFSRVREKMLEELLNLGIKDFRVLDAINKVKRHIFIDEALHSRAYENIALTIGHKQTISQPLTVARMTEELIKDLKGSKKFDRLLEIGSGCGYQSAILSYFANEVVGLERIKPLVIKSRQNLSSIGIRNVLIKHADGMSDISDLGKFDGIICAAAPIIFQEHLLDLINIGSRIIMPVGIAGKQKLNVYTKLEDNEYSSHELDNVSFVPMLTGLSVDD
ncbi:MAG: protein-L-isoaspartate O-methyltransferase [Gammaproteobacteria bacterium]